MEQDPMDYCICNGWCDYHKPGWPEGETCDCRPRTAEETERDRVENARMMRIFGLTSQVA